MPSLHQRVRTSIERREREAKAAADRAHDRAFNAEVRREVRADMRREALLNGDALPRNHLEAVWLARAECDL